MKTEPTPLGEFEQLILLAILRLEDSAYGVSIRQEIVDHARRTVAPGALYTTLERLEAKSLIVSTVGEPTPVRGGRSKRFYHVTKEGRTRLATAQSAFQRMLQGLKLIGGHYE
jgi:DNA-binding PadR family transcriptional regulator